MIDRTNLLVLSIPVGSTTINMSEDSVLLSAMGKSTSTGSSFELVYNLPKT